MSIISRNKYIPILCLFAAAIIWGSGFSFSFLSLNSYTPIQSLAGRFVVAAIFLMSLFWKKVIRAKRSLLIQGFGLGIILYFASLFQILGLQLTRPSQNAFITATNVVIVPIWAWILTRRKIVKLEWISALIALSGTSFISLSSINYFEPGDLLTLMCAVLFALHIFFTSSFTRDNDPLSLITIQMLTAGAIGLIIAVFQGDSFSLNLTSSLPGLLYLGIFPTAIAFLLQTVAQKYVDSVKASIILSTESLWGMLMSIIIVREQITIKLVIGAGLIVSAILMSQGVLQPKKKQQIDPAGQLE